MWACSSGCLCLHRACISSSSSSSGGQANVVIIIIIQNLAMSHMAPKLFFPVPYLPVGTCRYLALQYCCLTTTTTTSRIIFSWPGEEKKRKQRLRKVGCPKLIEKGLGWWIGEVGPAIYIRYVHTRRWDEIFLRWIYYLTVFVDQHCALTRLIDWLMIDREFCSIRCNADICYQIPSPRTCDLLSRSDQSSKGTSGKVGISVRKTKSLSKTAREVHCTYKYRRYSIFGVIVYLHYCIY